MLLKNVRSLIAVIFIRPRPSKKRSSKTLYSRALPFIITPHQTCYRSCNLQGGPPKLSQFGFLKFSINIEATWMCNMSYERKFCWLLGDIFKNCEKLSYGAEFAFFWQVAELANNPITRYW